MAVSMGVGRKRPEIRRMDGGGESWKCGKMYSIATACQRLGNEELRAAEKVE